MFKVCVAHHDGGEPHCLAQYNEIEQARSLADLVKATGDFDHEDVVVLDSGGNVIYKGVK